jgi:voltage-gated potassium channel
VAEVAGRGIAIFGYYSSAVEVAAYLRSADHRVVIIDDNPDNLDKARRAGYETAALDFRDDSELEKLGLGRDIDTVFSLFPDDAENVFLTISARALAPTVRIFTIAHGRGSVPNLRAAGADKVIETHEVVGYRIWDIMTRPVVTAILDRTLFGQHNLNLAEVPAGSGLAGCRVGMLDLESHYDLILLGVVDQEHQEHFVHGPNTQERVLTAEDILLVIGPADAIASLQEDLQTPGRACGGPADP